MPESAPAVPPSPELREIARNARIAALVWTAVVGAVLGGNILNERHEMLRMAQQEAAANINKDKAFRKWATGHGGVYVPPDERTPPNPYLNVPDRDVVTTTGKRLTLMNPAYMMREMQQGYAADYGIVGRITSLKPVNPINAPDPWETRALQAFEHGVREVMEVTDWNGRPHLRIIRPFVTEQGCLKCHEAQGYRVGDIRGGIGVAVPMHSYYAAAARSAALMALTHAVIWLLGLAGIWVIYRRSLGRARERARVHDDLTESRRLFQTVADYGTEWSYWRGSDGHLRYVSPASTAICGYSTEEQYLRPELYLEMVHPDDRQLWSEHVHAADANQQPRPLEFRILTKGGEERWISHTCRPISDVDGRFLGVRGSNTDVTERRQSEQLIHRLNQSLEQRVEEEVAKNREKDHLLIQQSRLAAMGEMIHNIAHQWRQPLNSLSIMLGNIKDDFERGELTAASLRQDVDRAYAVLHRMSRTIDDFRDFFRPDGDSPAPFDVASAVEEALFIIEAALKNNAIRVEKRLPPGIFVTGIYNQFTQVVLNLLANAKEAIQQHVPCDGEIHIVLTQSDNGCRLTIEDNAGGIPEEVMPKIFDPYFTTKEQGSGIGLFMSRTIIERNFRGRITAGNGERGAVITIEVPRA